VKDFDARNRRDSDDDTDVNEDMHYDPLYKAKLDMKARIAERSSKSSSARLDLALPVSAKGFVRSAKTKKATIPDEFFENMHTEDGLTSEPTSGYTTPCSVSQHNLLSSVSVWNNHTKPEYHVMTSNLYRSMRCLRKDRRLQYMRKVYVKS
jgi:hypothetical protein